MGRARLSGVWLLMRFFGKKGDLSDCGMFSVYLKK